MTIARFAALLRPDDEEIIIHIPAYFTCRDWPQSHVVHRSNLFTDSAVQFLQSCNEKQMTEM